MNISNAILCRCSFNYDLCLMAVHFNPEWNLQLLIMINHSSGFLFILLYFHKFNSWFKYGSFFYLNFILSVLTIQGNVYVLRRCRCSSSYGQTLYGYMGCLVHLLMMFLTVNNETVTHYLEIIYLAVERANLFCKVQ